MTDFPQVVHVHLIVCYFGGEREGKSFQIDEHSIFKSMLSAVGITLLTSKVEFQLFATLQHYPGWFFLLILPKNNTECCNYYSSYYYPTALRRVQITSKTSTNIMRYFYSS